VITGSSLQWLQILDEDETTQVVLVGEPGGNSEESAQYIAETIDKPVIVCCRLHAQPEKQGSPGALAQVVGRGANVGTVQSKLAAFKEVNVPELSALLRFRTGEKALRGGGKRVR